MGKCSDWLGQGHRSLPGWRGRDEAVLMWDEEVLVLRRFFKDIYICLVAIYTIKLHIAIINIS